MKIFVNSYTYIYDRHLRMFDFFQNKQDLVFLLPKIWKAKRGKIIVHPPEKPELNVIATWSPFTHSHYPIIRGLLKGWMPWCGRILRKLAQPGVVLLWSFVPNLFTTYLYGRLAKKLGLKHIWLTWQNIPYERRLRGMKLRITEWLIHRNVAVSAGALFGTRQAYEIHKKYLPESFQTAIIPQSGVDVDLFKPGPQVAKGNITFLFAAVFDERKGVMATINAFKTALEKVSDAHLIMIGMGKLGEPARRRVQELDMENFVTFIDWMPNQDLPGVFVSADILVHPSESFEGWEEQYGWTILQAEASGLPVIATNIGAIHEAVIDGVTGVIVPPKDAPALAGAMVALAQDPVRRNRMGIAGREHIMQNYSHLVIAHRLEEFLYSL